MKTLIKLNSKIAAAFMALVLAAGPAGAANMAPRPGPGGPVRGQAMSAWSALAFPVAITVSLSPQHFQVTGPISHSDLILPRAEVAPVDYSQTPLRRSLVTSRGLATPAQGAPGFLGQYGPIQVGHHLSATAQEKLVLVGQALGQGGDIFRLGSGQAWASGDRIENAMTGGRSFAGKGDAVPAPELPAGQGQGQALPAPAKLSAGEEKPAGPQPTTLEDEVEWGFGIVEKVRAEVARVVVGQEEAVDAILMALIARRHVLLEGVPGVAKTTMAKAVAGAVEGSFQRLQGTPDTLPADIRGSQILQKDLETGKQYFETVFGPIFANLFLADEINRLPPRVQSALLEAMEEGQVTIGGKTYKLERLTVIATQNPVEQDGTYRLPEAQVDRFFLKVIVNEPSEDEDIEVGRRNESLESQPTVSKVTTLAEMDRIRQIAARLPLSEALERYIVKIARAASHQTEFKKFVQYSVSTRASIYLRQAARIHALMRGRAWVTPSDVKAVAPLILRHRITLNYQSAGKMSVEELIGQILDRTPFEDDDRKPKGGPAKR